MIAYIDGKLAHKDPTYVIIDVNGVGYQIKISLSTYSSLPAGERCKLHTYLHIKEDAHTLYGFTTAAEKDVFLHLIS
ncbi:MAG: Holliday junction branch migration protein RuvA, partial [Hymenobacteraceae bacterium]|nr:Holliday junction branch migration protein RuvA [Hymenobacteraceae bacterium]